MHIKWSAACPWRVMATRVAFGEKCSAPMRRNRVSSTDGAGAIVTLSVALGSQPGIPWAEFGQQVGAISRLEGKK